MDTLDEYCPGNERKKTVSGPMKMVFEDITQEKLSWLVECVDEMFSDLDENDTY